MHFIGGGPGLLLALLPKHKFPDAKGLWLPPGNLLPPISSLSLSPGVRCDPGLWILNGWPLIMQIPKMIYVRINGQFDSNVFLFVKSSFQCVSSNKRLMDSV